MCPELCGRIKAFSVVFTKAAFKNLNTECYLPPGEVDIEQGTPTIRCSSEVLRFVLRNLGFL